MPSYQYSVLKDIIQKCFTYIIEGHNMLKKYSFSIPILLLLLIFNTASASLKDDSNIIFDWAEQQFPQLFPPTGQTTQTFDIWYYRYYPDTGIILAVDNNSQVYVMGGEFGNSPVLVGAVLDFITAISGKSRIVNPGNGNCQAIINPSVGTVLTYDDGSTTTILENTSTYFKFKDESATEDTFFTSTSSGTTTGYYKIINGNVYFIHTEAIGEDHFTYDSTISETTKDIFGADSSSSYLFTHTPYIFSGPAYEVCEKQSWYVAEYTSKWTGTQIIDGVESSINETILGGGSTVMIDEMNKSVTVPAGTFNTYKRIDIFTGSKHNENLDNASIYSISWYDIKSGILVKSQNYQNGRLFSPTQLISLSQ